jgi:hypothetical protein
MAHPSNVHALADTAAIKHEDPMRMYRPAQNGSKAIRYCLPQRKYNKTPREKRQAEPQTLSGHSVGPFRFSYQPLRAAIIGRHPPAMGNGYAQHDRRHQNRRPLVEHKPPVPRGSVVRHQRHSDQDESRETPPQAEPPVAFHPLNPLPPHGRGQPERFLHRLQVAFNPIKFWFHRISPSTVSVCRLLTSVY